MVRQVNWLLFDQPPQPLSLSVKLRYRQPGLPATVCPAENGRAVVSFDTPQAAAAPGQSAVFYDGDVVVGGGIIE
jgi:tRNA-specific 2-thiouridylase